MRVESKGFRVGFIQCRELDGLFGDEGGLAELHALLAGGLVADLELERGCFLGGGILGSRLESV